MHPLIAAHLDEIRGLCFQHRVASLELVGSAAGADFDPSRSDIDFIVRFLPGTSGGFDHPYFKLHDALERLLGRRVDLIAAEAIRNPFLESALNQRRVGVYAAA
jgi:predicted nucleotidyltransferase